VAAVVEDDLAEAAEATAGVEHELSGEALDGEIEEGPELGVESVETRVAVEMSRAKLVPLEREGIGVVVGCDEAWDEALDRELVLLVVALEHASLYLGVGDDLVHHTQPRATVGTDDQLEEFPFHVLPVEAARSASM
jgi:hypothetical protein